jgi:alditol oxidase
MSTPEQDRSNWAGSLTYSAAEIHYPETVEQVRGLVARSSRVRALGTRHSFNSIADTTGDLICLARLERTVELDRERETVTVSGGVRYGELCRALDGERFALHNMASLPHISVAGACATATHGSGDSNGNLATAVTALEMVTADGGLAVLSPEQSGEDFDGTVVGLGALGIVTKVTLRVGPAFQMRQDVYEELPMAALESHFDEVTSEAYSVSLFTDWQNASFSQVWCKRRVSDGRAATPRGDLFGARLAAAALHPIASMSPENCTQQLGVYGPWHERMPHFRLEFTPSCGEELQTEYLVPRRHALAAFEAVRSLRDGLAPLLQISEIRTVASDALWLSPCYGEACVGIHFTWEKDWPKVLALLPRIEEALAPFEARPHWGKCFTVAPARLKALYRRLPDFRLLMTKYDPAGKFRNAFVEKYICGERD